MSSITRTCRSSSCTNVAPAARNDRAPAAPAFASPHGARRAFGGLLAAVRADQPTVLWSQKLRGVLADRPASAAAAWRRVGRLHCVREGRRPFATMRASSNGESAFTKSCYDARIWQEPDQRSIHFAKYCTATSASIFALNNKNSRPGAQLTVFCIPHTMEACSAAVVL